MIAFYRNKLKVYRRLYISAKKAKVQESVVQAIGAIVIDYRAKLNKVAKGRE
jgi:hypothetical protein